MAIVLFRYGMVGLLTLAIAAGAGVVARGAPRVPKADNPHWKRDTCGACHAIKDGKTMPISPEAADEVCLKCHDGVAAAEEFHPVGRDMTEKFLKPRNWPLVENKLVCVTCHDMRPGCSETIERPAANRMFLREWQAGRSKGQPFCRNCHQETAYRKLNPHMMLLVEQDEIIDEKCLFCHEKPLDRKAMARTGNAALKADQQSLCRDCHPQHKDPMPQQHLGMKLGEDTLAYMRAREMMGLSATLGPKLLEQVKKDGGKPTLMVPQKGAIDCSTCHNPHQAGVFPRDSVLAYRAMKPANDGKLQSPVRGQTWCKHCHEL